MNRQRRFDPTPVRRLYNRVKPVGVNEEDYFNNSAAAVDASALNSSSVGTSLVDQIRSSKAAPNRPASKQQAREAATAAPPQPASPTARDDAWLADVKVDFEHEIEEISKLNLSSSTSRVVKQLKEAQSTSTPEPADPIPAQSSSPTPSLTPAPVDTRYMMKRSLGRPIHVPYTPDLRARSGIATNTHTHSQQKPMGIRDYQLLAEACQRAGKARMEGHAYYKIGELLAQSPDTVPKAIAQFQKYLNICRRLNDLQGEAKALNCIGIAYSEMEGEEQLLKALEFHRQHSEISDAAGIFIANTNMGLIYGSLDQWLRAIDHHKQALQYAYRAGDKQAEALALANLGLMGRSQGDLSTAQVCIERHLELANSLKDDVAAASAYEQLGLLSSEKGDYADAARLFIQAMEIFLQQGNQLKANQVKCNVGIVNGQLKMEEHMRAIARTMGARQERKGRKHPVGDSSV